MEIVKKGQVLDVVLEEGEITYYVKQNADSKMLIRTCGHIHGNSFRYDGIILKKYGRGMMKKEAQVHSKIEEVEKFLRKQGYFFTT